MTTSARTSCGDAPATRPGGGDARRSPVLVAVPARRHRPRVERGARRASRARPDATAATWDEYLASARAVVRREWRRIGCTFDPRGWRSLVPIAHSFGDDDLVHGRRPLRLRASRDRRGARGSCAAWWRSRIPTSWSPRRSSPRSTPTRPHVRRADGRVLRQVPERTRAVRERLAGPDQVASGAFARKRRPRRHRLLVDWRRSPPLRAEQARRSRLRDRPDARRADLATLDGDGARCRGPASRVQHPSGMVERRPRPGWRRGFPLSPRRISEAKPIRPHVLGEEQFKVSRPSWEEYLRGSEPSARRALSRAMAKVREAAARVSG